MILEYSFFANLRDMRGLKGFVKENKSAHFGLVFSHPIMYREYTTYAKLFLRRVARLDYTDMMKTINEKQNL